MDCAHDSDGSHSHITNQITTVSVCFASFGVCLYLSTPFAAEWNVRRAFFVYPWLETTGVCATNGGMNGGHEQQNGTTLCLLTNPASACNITMVGFEFGDTVVTALSAIFL
ncbi:hypothetical protein TNCV_2139201 [Trichonephila clavipes]|uniref:Uncharacterized protein n=1 Tax=Trichonephila clavipes TaxID=2585209 RepID=A0A8X6RWN7_TRICX|nr:hypothetical protein TNCV_2139201 [Trichonephila clavipes]